MQTAIDIYFVILWVGAGGYLLLLFVFIAGWLKTEEFQTSEPQRKPKVSIVVAVRNEEENLPAFLKSLVSQNYPSGNMEIIIVDDHSEDDTYEILKRESEKAGNLTVLKATGKGKKAAVAQGFSAASGELVVTTDADCIPGKTWISTMVACYAEKKPLLILGPVVYANEKGFLQKFFSLDFISLVASGAGSQGMKLPLSGNAANMAISGRIVKEIVSMNEGQSFASGDDVFLLHYVAKKYGPGSVCFLKSRQAIVETAPPAGLKEFVLQRIRWGSKAVGYKMLWPKVVAVVVFLFNLMLFTTLAAGFFRPELWILYALLVLMKFLADYPLLKGFSVFTFKEGLLKYAFPFEIIYPVYLTVTALLSMVVPYTWKGRRGLR